MTVRKTPGKRTAATKSRTKSSARPKSAAPGWTLAEAMAALEKAGSAQTRKTYLRHGAKEPLFGTSFATLKELRKRIGVDHDLACALWDTGNFDARNLAVKVADPAKATTTELNRWARDGGGRTCLGYVAALASEGPHGMSRANAWLASRDVAIRATGWSLVGVLAMRDETTPDAWFLARLADLEGAIHAAPNEERAAMNHALIALGCRSASLRRAATAAAGRIGPVDVDHGDTACKTPSAAEYLAKTWAHSTAKGFETPAAHERTREPMRLRC